MSFYGKKFKVNGLPCGLVMRGVVNGQYQVVIEREYAALEQIEAVNWRRPKIEGDCDPLPKGYGFDVVDIQYRSSSKSYTVTLQVMEQYLGDVTGYQVQVAELAEQANAAREETESIRQAAQEREAELVGEAAARETALAAAYEEGVESNG